MKTVLVTFGAAAMLMGCASTAQEEAPPATAAAADPTSPAAAADPTSPLSPPGYMSMAASSDMFEIESSRLALQQSQNPQVQSFAQTMIDHHTRTSQEMPQVAQSAGLTPPPPQMLPPHQAALDRIRAAGPGQFDAAYKQEQISGHQQALDLHRNYAAQGDVPPLRDFANRTAPIVQGHLTQAQGLPDYAPPPPPPASAPTPTPAQAGERG